MRTSSSAPWYTIALRRVPRPRRLVGASRLARLAQFRAWALCVSVRLWTQDARGECWRQILVSVCFFGLRLRVTLGWRVR